jgi:hypothetical protein
VRAAGLGILTALGVHGQGTFQNLDFESAIIVTSGDPHRVLATLALPDWLSRAPTNATIYHNNLSIGGAAISIHDINDPGSPPLAGRYSVSLQGAIADTGAAEIYQTGQIPGNTQSLIFW